MSQTTVFAIIGLIWLVGMIVFLKDYLLGERKVERRRGAPTLHHEKNYGSD